jgi:16S rRNA G966 N2-methylase RsmD
VVVTNTLFYGDNLEILRKHVGDETVDLIYLDPPFNPICSHRRLLEHRRSSSNRQLAKRVRARAARNLGVELVD